MHTITLPAGVASLPECYSFCRSYTKGRAKNFYYAFAVLPPAKRRAIYAAYAFAGHCDDVADEPGDPAEKAARLAAYRAQLRACYQGDRRDPLFRALGDAVDQFRIPARYFEDLLAGIEMDLTIDRYASFEDLRLYCYRVASTIGLICVSIFGHRPHPQAEQVAADMGVALQLTNIMRDVREDAERGRVYLPQEDLRRFGCREETLRSGQADGPFRELLAFEATRARSYFASGRRLLPLLDPRSRMCVNVLQGVYAEILRRIEGCNFDVLSGRVSLSSGEKIRLIGKLWLQALLPGRTSA